MTIKYERHKMFGYTSYKEFYNNGLTFRDILNTAYEYLQEFEENEYRYSVEYIERKFDLKKQFVQRKLIPNMETLFVTVPVKELIKSSVYLPDIIAPSLYLKEQFSYNGKFSNIFSLMDNALLISKSSLREMISDTIYKVKVIDEIENIIELNNDEIEMIFKSRLYSVNSLRLIFDLHHDTQIYRKINYLLSVGKIMKVAIIPFGSLSDRKLIRYYILDKNLIKDVS